MKKYLNIFFVLLLTVLSCSCASDFQSDSKKSDSVPDEVIYEFMNNKYNYHYRMYTENSGWKSKPTYNNAINIYQKEDVMINNNTFMVNLKAIVNSEICTKDVELQYELQFENDDWYSISTNEIVNSIDWNYSYLMDCWWSGGVGLNYGAFYITDINTENQTMNIIDNVNREYETDYKIFDDHIEINVKYTGSRKLFIYSEGPCFNGYFMTKK